MTKYGSGHSYTLDGAAMEPAGDRPDDLQYAQRAIRLGLPQWSRPGIGRMTAAPR